MHHFHLRLVAGPTDPMTWQRRLSHDHVLLPTKDQKCVWSWFPPGVQFWPMALLENPRSWYHGSLSALCHKLHPASLPPLTPTPQGLLSYLGQAAGLPALHLGQFPSFCYSGTSSDQQSPLSPSLRAGAGFLGVDYDVSGCTEACQELCFLLCTGRCKMQ